ncbi:MAG: hypothetical protein ACW967_00470 [Candidatus Hodarchaeales archaeon]
MNKAILGVFLLISFGFIPKSLPVNPFFSQNNNIGQKHKFSNDSLSVRLVKIRLLPNSNTFSVEGNLFNSNDEKVTITTATIIFPFFVQLNAFPINNKPIFTNTLPDGQSSAVRDWIFETGNNYHTWNISVLPPILDLPDGDYFFEIHNIQNPMSLCDYSQIVYVKIDNGSIIETDFDFRIDNKVFYENISSTINRIEILNQQNDPTFTDQIYLNVSFQIKDQTNPEKEKYPISSCNVLDYQIELIKRNYSENDLEKNIQFYSSNSYSTRHNLEDSKIPIENTYPFSFHLSSKSLRTTFPDGLYYLKIVDENRYLADNSLGAHFTFENHTIFNISYEKDSIIDNNTIEDRSNSNFYVIDWIFPIFDLSIQLTLISSVGGFFGLILAIIMRKVQK